jgi:sporulation protein YhbH
MTVRQVDWDFSKRGQEDVARHQKKIKESIRENIADVISEESIITRKKGTTVKIPIKGIKSYQFIYGKRKGSGEGQGQYGLGHGKKNKGDVLGRRPAPGGDGQGNQQGKGGKPSDSAGEDYMETEVDIEELIAMMMDDLQLPDLRRKEIAETVVPAGWNFEDIEKHGLKPNLDKKRSFRQAIKRAADSVSKLAEKTGKPLEICQKALNKFKGDYQKALELLKRPDPEIEAELADQEDKLKPFIQHGDLRYRVVKENLEHHSNAVILAMMDVSGSMSTTKKYLARSFFFWMVEFLKHKYRNVEIRFIAHTSEAKLVEEEEFFHKGESGGTICASAYELACDLIESDYPPSKWNIYAFHFSDGEDWDPAKTMTAVKRLMDKNPNMVGYGEIRTEVAYGQQLMRNFEETFSLERYTSYRDSDFEYYLAQRNDLPLAGTILKNKGHVYPALKVFFSKEKRI